MADEKLEIEIVLDNGQIVKGLATVKRSAKKAANEIDSSFKSAFTNIRKELITFAAGFASLRIAQTITQDFIKFERALVGVGKTTNIAEKDLGLIGTRLQELSTQIPVTATDLLRLAQVAGQFGVRGSDNIIKFAETVGKLQFAIEGIDPETAAQSLVRMLNVTGQGVKDIDRLSSVLVALGNNFEATEGDILATGNEVIRATAQFGLSAQEGLALGAALQSVGAKAEGSGTAVGDAFIKIAQAIGGGGKKLKDFTKVLGISGEELKKQFNEDALSVFQLLIKRLGEVKGGSVGLTVALRELGLDNKRTLKSLVPLVFANDKLTAALSSQADEYTKNSALNIEFGRVNRTTGSAVERLKNELTALSTTLGSLIGPRLKENIQFFTDAARGIRNFISSAGASGPLSLLDSQIESVNERLRGLQAEQFDLTQGGIGLDRFFLDTDQAAKDLQPAIDALALKFAELTAQRNALVAASNVPLDPIKTDDAEGEQKSPILQQFDPSELVPSFTSAFKTIDETVAMSVDNFGARSDQLKKKMVEIGVAARNQLAGGIGQAFASFGKALANGDNAIEAFAKTFISAIGQMAIQSGTRFILEGLAYSVVPGFQGVGAAMIASGAALATFGGVLSAVTGGGGGEASASTPLSPTNVTLPEDQDFGEDLVEEKTTKVAINVEGTVLDPQQVGNQIAQILNDTFEAGGTRVVTA